MQTVINRDISQAKYFLDAGELVAIPTETVYGLAANALSAEAVAKIYETKNRPQFNPLILHIASTQEIEKYVTIVPDKIKRLIDAFMPGPLTILLPKRAIVPDLITAGSSQVAIRVPQTPITQSLLSILNYPLAAPSANPSGYVSPTSAQHVRDGLNGKIPYILDGGVCEVGLESTIIGYNFDTEKVVLHRLGGLGIEEIENIVQERIEEKLLHSSPETPGQLKSHYATKTPLYLGNIQDLISGFSAKNIILINYQEAKPYPALQQFILSPTGDISIAAKNLFSILREADSYNAEYILSELAPDTGIGRAINDRLRKAQAINKS